MNENRKLELKEFAKRKNYEYFEDGGQIILTNRSNLRQLDRNAEVFIGKIPKDIDFRQLISKFSEVGSIYMFRIMINFSGLNRGYAFAQFTKEEEAKQAIDKLNNYELNYNPDNRIVVLKSRNNCRLYVGKIDSKITNLELENFFKKLTPEIKNIFFHRDKNQDLPYFYAFLEYETHRDAAKARRILKEDELKLGNYILRIDWATLHNETYLINNFRLNNNQIRFNNSYNDYNSDLSRNTPISQTFNNSQQIKGQMIDSLKKNLSNYYDVYQTPFSKQISNSLFSNQFSIENTFDNNQFSNQSLRSFSNLSSFQLSTPSNYQLSNELRALDNHTSNQQLRPFENQQLRPFENQQLRPFENQSFNQLSRLDNPINQRSFESSNNNLILCLTNVRYDVNIEDIKTIFKIDNFEIIKLERKKNLILIYLDSITSFTDIFIDTFNEIQDKFSLLFGESNKKCELYVKSDLSFRDDFQSLNDSLFSMNLNHKF